MSQPTPYITGNELLNSSIFTGMSDWSQVTSDVVDDLNMIAATVTDIIDAECGKELFNNTYKNYILRASQDTETAVTTERIRALVDSNNNLVFITTFRPIRTVVSMSYQIVPGQGLLTPATNVVTIDPSLLYFEGREITAIGSWSTGVSGAFGGWGTSYYGGYFGSVPLRVSVDYINGYPNTELTQIGHSGSNSIYLDDVIGINPLDSLTIFDKSPEYIQVSSSYVVGSNPVTLTNNLLNDHAIGIRVSELDLNLRQAAIWFAMDLVQSRSQQGVTASRKAVGTGSVPLGATDFYQKAVRSLNNYILTP